MFKWLPFGHHGRGLNQNGHKVNLVNQDSVLEKIYMLTTPGTDDRPSLEPEPNGRARMLKILDLLIASLTSSNGWLLAKAGVLSFVMGLFYVMVLDNMAQSKMDRDFFREEMRRSHNKDQEIADTIRAAVDEMRRFNEEARRRAKEARP